MFYNLICLLGLVFSVVALKKWYQIPNHDEEIFINYEDTVPNFAEAKKLCEQKNAINLVLYKKIVIEFMIRKVLMELSLENLGKCWVLTFI